MNSTIRPAAIVTVDQLNQAHDILSVLDRSKRNVLIEFTPAGVRVETEQLNGVEGHSCPGEDIFDALGQLTTVLALSEDEDDELTDTRIPYSLEEPIEFCAQFVLDESRAVVAAE